MQVRKFEAQSIKDALEMIKTHLGPDAIILAAKDNRVGFGLLGQKSVEITAAISDKQLQKREWAESRLNVEDLRRLRGSSAAVQKAFIEKSVNRYSTKAMSRPITQRRYIDIDDNEASLESDVNFMNKSSGQSVESLLDTLGSKRHFNETAKPKIQKTVSQTAVAQPAAAENLAENRVKAAVKSALNAFDFQDEKPKVTTKATTQPSPEVTLLKDEIFQLKQIIQGFKTQRSNTTLHPGAHRGVPYEMSDVFQKLTRAGVLDEYALELIKEARKILGPANINKNSLVEGWVAKKMMSEIQVIPRTMGAKFQVFVGPRGHGKTSTIVKYASELVIHQNKKVAIVSADVEKVGAKEQLKIYAQILNIPFATLNKKEDWDAIHLATKAFDYVLVDFPGMTLTTMDEITRIKNLLPEKEISRDLHLVISSTSKDADIFSLAERYKLTHYNDVIFTRLDESVSHGVIYNFFRKIKKPLHSFGVGPNIPEDFEFATKERVIDLIFRISKFNKAERGV